MLRKEFEKLKVGDTVVNRGYIKEEAEVVDITADTGIVEIKYNDGTIGDFSYKHLIAHGNKTGEDSKASNNEIAVIFTCVIQDGATYAGSSIFCTSDQILRVEEHVKSISDILNERG